MTGNSRIRALLAVTAAFLGGYLYLPAAIMGGTPAPTSVLQLPRPHDLPAPLRRALD